MASPARTPDTIADALRYYGERMGLRKRLESAMSLDQPKNQDVGDIAADIALGFTPLQYPQAARDFERARRESDPIGMGLASLAAIPVVGGVSKAAGRLRKMEDVVAARKAAMEAAQINAAKPVAEGGLGLHAANTPMERAQAMGFEPFYHGTERLDRVLEKPGLDPRRATSGPMPYGTSDPNLASSYATSKFDTSRIAQDTGDFANYFQTPARNVGGRGDRLVNVEQTFWSLSPETQATIRNRINKIGYENPETAEGAIKLHETPGTSIASNEHIDYLLKRESNNNPLTALRKLWAESGALYDNEQKLADIYKLAGYPHEISQTNAPWTSAEGVLTGSVRMTNPINTNDKEQILSILPALKEAVKNDRSRLKAGADPWAKESRYTPKEWVAELENDLKAGHTTNRVWTSIPDKITEALKAQGFDGIKDFSGKMIGQTREKVLIPFGPSQVRSRFAAFDPAKINSPDLLAGMAGPTVLAAALMEQQRREKERKEAGL